MSRVLLKGLVNQMRCSASSTGLEISHKIISHLSFCSAWLTMELWQIILTRYHWEVCLERGSAKQTRLSCEKGRINMACTWIWVFYLAFGEIFQMLLRRTEESTPQNWFCSNEWEILQWHRCSSCCVSVWKQHFRIFFYYTCVCMCVRLWMSVWQSPVVRESAETCHQPC